MQFYVIGIYVFRVLWHEDDSLWSVAYRGGLGGSNPLPEIPKALQNRAKLNPIVKTVKNC